MTLISLILSALAGALLTTFLHKLSSKITVERIYVNGVEATEDVWLVDTENTKIIEKYSAGVVITSKGTVPLTAGVLEKLFKSDTVSESRQVLEKNAVRYNNGEWYYWTSDQNEAKAKLAELLSKKAEETINSMK